MEMKKFFYDLRLIDRNDTRLVGLAGKEGLQGRLSHCRQ